MEFSLSNGVGGLMVLNCDAISALCCFGPLRLCFKNITCFKQLVTCSVSQCF